MTEQGVRVLLVDDDLDAHLLIRNLLSDIRGQSVELDCVSGFRAARKQILKAEHDVCLINHRLQQGGGLDLLRDALDAGVTAPLIILTAEADAEMDIASMDAGAADYLVKASLDTVTLTRVIRYALSRARDQQQLLQSESRFRNVLEQASDPLLIIGDDEQVLFANAASHRALPDETALRALFPLPASGRGEREIPAAGGGESRVFEVRTSRTGWKDTQASLVSLRDVTTNRQTEFMLRLRERAVECGSNGVVIADVRHPDQPLIYANPAFCRMTGYPLNEVVGRNCRFLQGAHRDQPGIAVIRQAIREAREGHAVLRNFRKDGSEFWNELHVAPVRDEQGQVTHYVGIQNDVTDRRRFEEELAYRAGHDTLTGLPNRVLLMDRLEQAAAVARRQRRRLAVMFIDLDGFKVFNDSQGHLLGDELLRTVAERLRACGRGTDTVSRLGGDEFVMLCTDLASDHDVSIIAKRILQAVSRPMVIDRHTIYITCSIGISLFPSDAQTPEELLRDADLAVYRAKENGCNGFALFTADLNESVSRRLLLGNELHRSLEREQFHLVYQPQINVSSRRVIGLEALLRWEHPELGAVSPAEFIPVAENSGLIMDIGEWVLRTACRQQRAWVAMGLPAYRIAVNVSARQFARNTFLDVVRAALEDTGLPPAMLELELTESVFMENAEAFLETLHGLRELGVTLSIDDFGTGYSSLSYLKRFPIDRLKIDRSFVNDITVDNDDAAIVRAMMAMAHSLRLGVVAEGVETQEQFAFLRALGCEDYQGFLFSRPLSVKQVEELGDGTQVLAGGLTARHP